MHGHFQPSKVEGYSPPIETEEHTTRAGVKRDSTRGVREEGQREEGSYSGAPSSRFFENSVAAIPTRKKQLDLSP